MSYQIVAVMAGDTDLQERLMGCAAMEGIPSPDLWVPQRVWGLVASQEWASAWTYAVNAGVERPGADPAVITDQMILSAIQMRRDS